MVIFFLSFALFTSIMIFNKPLSKLTRASNAFSADSDSSLILVWPLTAKADGKTRVEVNVFIRNNSQNGALALSNKVVKLNSTLGTISGNNASTNKQGKATFSLTSDATGIAEITAEVPGDNVLIKQKTSVKFE